MRFIPLTVQDLRDGAHPLSPEERQFIKGWPADFHAWWEADYVFHDLPYLVVREPPNRAEARRREGRLALR
jgi:hypothetical protein